MLCYGHCTYPGCLFPRENKYAISFKKVLFEKEKGKQFFTSALALVAEWKTVRKGKGTVACVGPAEAIILRTLRSGAILAALTGDCEGRTTKRGGMIQEETKLKLDQLKGLKYKLFIFLNIL